MAWSSSASRTAASCACASPPPGYEKDWHCQFPKALREKGARFVVDEVRPSAKGGFYRVFGEIRKLVS